METDRKISAFGITIAKRHAAAAGIALAVTASLLLTAILPAAADTRSKTTRLTEDQKIIHILNRIGFGPRPGDVERVKKIGIDKYIEQQLHPDRIDDSALQAKLAGLESLGMSIGQVLDKYPAPQEIARELGLRPGKGKPANPQATPNPVQAGGQEGEESKDQQREQRQKVLAYYAQHGLKPPAELIQELQAQKIIRAVYSERQLQEVMADFWFNHFNIYWAKGADKWMTTDFEMSAIRPHTLGKFQDLLLATAKSPAMLFYLDNFQSTSPNATMPGRRGIGQGGQFQNRRGPLGGPVDPRIQERLRQRMEQRGQLGNQGQMTPEEQQRRAEVAKQLKKRTPGINENYAREIMELHTLGVDGGYTQKDVQEVARCFTGWTIQQPRQDGSFIFRQFMHDNGEKVVLGQKIPAGGGMKDAEKVIEILAHHPNTAKFISTKLVHRFVSDNPPSSLIDRVTGVYMKTGGDIREVLRAIVTSQEFLAPESYRAKIKSPFELAVSSVRALGGETIGSRPIAQFIGKMGQPLYAYQAPTGYPDRAEQWVNTGALLERLNFGLALGSNRVPGTTIDPKVVTATTTASKTNQLMDRALKVLLNGDVSAETRAILDKQLKEGVPVKGELGDLSAKAIRQADGVDGGDSMMASDSPKGAGGKGARKDQRAMMEVYGRRGDRQAAGTPVDPEVARVVGLVLGSPEFQRR
ncbi:MAG TPA: DUF1800 domain-containing protein [Blastocatellia bacterium]|jgi:uncharacterized protein (DUF1800 family)|nr:DUF1800 domain-containing protein [Blastocatellia bacterium]